MLYFCLTIYSAKNIALKNRRRNISTPFYTDNTFQISTTEKVIKHSEFDFDIKDGRLWLEAKEKKMEKKSYLISEHEQPSPFSSDKGVFWKAFSEEGQFLKLVT